MFGRSSLSPFLYLGLLIIALSSGLAAQDLGSSNKLFGGKKNASTTVKKSPSVSRSRNAQPTAARAKKRARGAVTVSKAPVRIAPRPIEKTPVISKPQLRATDSARYLSLMSGAKSAWKILDLRAAESLFREAAELNPWDPAAFISLGSLYSETLRWEKAEKAIRAALELDKKNPDVYDALSRVLSQPVVSADLSARYDEAEILARKAIQLNGRSAAIYDQLGAALERRGLIGPETESAYRRAISSDPLYAPSYAHLARLLRRNGKLELAKMEYSRATSNAVDVPQMIAVAESFQSEQRTQDSVPLLRTALHLEPRNYAALVLLGRTLAAGGEFAAAETNFILATRVSPSSYAAFGELGRVYLRSDKTEMAEAVMSHAAGVADSFERVELASDYETLGDRYAKKTNVKAAQKAYQTSMALDATRGSIAAKIAGLRR